MNTSLSMGALVFFIAQPLWAQEPTASLPTTPKNEPQVVQETKDPYAAFEAGQYDQALQHFVDEQIERPENVAMMLNIGAAHYKMGNFEEAKKSFGAAALRAQGPLRAEALYNLGNVAYRMGKLEEAIGYYQGALELRPEDQDAKYNIEFVRDEMRRRHEEAKKRQNEQQQKGEEEQQQDSGQEKQDGNNKPDTPPDSNQNSNQDGLPDEDERSAKKPTDPTNPDTKEAQTSETQGKMTPEQAARFLEALEEGKQPNRKHRGAKGRRPQRAKDW